MKHSGKESVACDAVGCPSPSVAIKNGHTFYWCGSNDGSASNLAKPDRARYHPRPEWLLKPEGVRRLTCQLARICITCCLDHARIPKAMMAIHDDELRTSAPGYAHPSRLVPVLLSAATSCVDIVLASNNRIATGSDPAAPGTLVLRLLTTANC